MRTLRDVARLPYGSAVVSQPVWGWTKGTDGTHEQRIDRSLLASVKELLLEDAVDAAPHGSHSATTPVEANWKSERAPL